jgi:hypothetical protein
MPHIVFAHEITVAVAEDGFEQDFDREGEAIKIGREAGLGEVVEAIEVIVAL